MTHKPECKMHSIGVFRLRLLGIWREGATSRRWGVGSIESRALDQVYCCDGGISPYSA